MTVRDSTNSAGGWNVYTLGGMVDIHIVYAPFQVFSHYNHIYFNVMYFTF